MSDRLMQTATLFNYGFLTSGIAGVFETKKIRDETEKMKVLAKRLRYYTAQWRFITDNSPYPSREGEEEVENRVLDAFFGDPYFGRVYYGELKTAKDLRDFLALLDEKAAVLENMAADSTYIEDPWLYRLCSEMSQWCLGKVSHA